MLKNVILSLTLFVIHFSVILAADIKNAPLSLAWEKSFDDAVAKAKTANKSILLDFFAPT